MENVSIRRRLLYNLINKSMKLLDVTQVKILSEGRIEPSALMSLEQVAATGHFTNKFEEFVLAKFSTLIKDGLFWCTADPVFTGAVTVSTSMLNALRNLPPEELKVFAAQILTLAQQKNGETYACAPSMTPGDWMQLYTKHEATD